MQGLPIAPRDPAAPAHVVITWSCAELDHQPEASKVIQDATREFKDTPQAAHIVIVNSELALKRGDVQVRKTDGQTGRQADARMSGAAHSGRRAS